MDYIIGYYTPRDQYLKIRLKQSHHHEYKLVIKMLTALI